MSEFYNQFFCSFNQSYSLIIEDDGRVGYAYLLYKDAIIGDVWLYNQLLTPVYAEWDKQSEMPFLNSLEFVKENISPLNEDDKIDLKWTLYNDSVLDNVLIFINHRLIAKLADGSTPGWSSIVVKEGPLAKILQKDRS